MKRAVLAAVLLLSSSILYADISITDRSSTLRFLSDTTVLRPRATKADPAARAARRAANQAKREAKLAKRHPGRLISQSFHPHALGTGAQVLTDNAGLQYFINTDMSFSSTSSASAGASTASFTGPVIASTMNGGTSSTTLTDMFDSGYNSICISLTGGTGPCSTSLPYTMYNQNGPALFDTTVPAGPNCTNRQLAFPAQTIGAISVSRKVFVPFNDSFIRWMDSFTNTSGASVTFTRVNSGNLGSDKATLIVSSSNGDNVAQTTDTWITSFQDWGFDGNAPNQSTDPRIGHVLQGTGAPTPVSFIHFVDGDDAPWWAYSITLAPGQTKIILNFATGQPTKAAANAKAAALALLPLSSTQCMSATELSEVTNFATSTDLSIVKNTAASFAFGGNPITFTLAVTNNGPSQANTVSVSDTLPAGSTFVSASGTGWGCNNVAGVVTCSVATLPVGAAPVINLTFNAPPVAVAGTLSNTATVSSATTDTNSANNSSTKTVPILPGNQIPALSAVMLMLLAAVLGAIALVRRT